MKKILISSVIALAFLSSCGDKAAKPTNDSASAPATTTTAPASGTQIAAVKYQCPMNCENGKTYDAAGKCPKCGMDMKEVK